MSELFITYVLGAVPEALFFSLFLILCKDLKEKRALFAFLMYVEFVILKVFISYDVWFQIIYTFMTFLILKMLYKDKAQITDIFAFAAASILLIIIGALSYMLVYYTVGIYAVAYILNRLLLFGVLYLLRNKLKVWYKKFMNLWQKKMLKEKQKMKKP